MSDVSVRPAAIDEQAAVASVLDSAMLETDGFEAALADGRVLVAVADGRVLGAILYTTPHAGEHAHIVAIAVRPGRRGQGIGSKLVAALATDGTEITAEFESAVRPFYESLGFSIDSRGDGLLWGRVPTDEW